MFNKYIESLSALEIIPRLFSPLPSPQPFDIRLLLLLSFFFLLFSLSLLIFVVKSARHAVLSSPRHPGPRRLGQRLAHRRSARQLRACCTRRHSCCSHDCRRVSKVPRVRLGLHQRVSMHPCCFVVVVFFLLLQYRGGDWDHFC